MNILVNGELPISTIQNTLKSIYNKRNSSINNGFEYAFSFLVRKVSYLQRAVNDSDSSSIKNQIIKSLSWLFSLANLEGINIENSFRRKYPSVCPYCISSSCVCGVTNKTAKDGAYYEKAKENLSALYQAQVSVSQYVSLDRAVSIIMDIYPSNALVWKTHGGMFIFSKLLEEMGEVHEAYSRLKKPHGKENREKLIHNLQEEFADVFVWLLSIWFITQGKRSITTAFNSYYEMGCPVCCKMECECDSYSDRKPIDSEKEKLLELRENIQKLKDEMNSSNAEVDVIMQKTLSSIDVALNEDTNLSIKSAIADTKSKMNDLSSLVQKTEVTSSSVSKIIENILNIVNVASRLIN